MRVHCPSSRHVVPYCQSTGRKLFVRRDARTPAGLRLRRFVSMRASSTMVAGYGPAAVRADATLGGGRRCTGRRATERSCSDGNPCGTTSKSWASSCPFVNLPDRAEGRWGEGLTAGKMAMCRWLDPFIVIRIGFLA
jgi:hypothetical protein